MVIQNGKEWDEVQSNYQKHSLSFRQNPNAAYAGLALVEIFTQEARVTGEHGHYYPAALQLVNQVLNSDSLATDMKFYAKTLQAGVMLSQHDFAAALEVALEAKSLRPSNAQIQGVLVDCYVELGKYEKAIAAADAMIRLRPDLRSYARVSYLREIHGDMDGALQAMQLAVSAGLPGREETAWAGLQLAELLHRTNRDEMAIKILNEILQERPNYPFAKGALAEIKLKQGDLVSAKNYAEEAIQAIPEVGFYMTLAKYYKAQKDEAAFAKTTDEILVMLADDVSSGHNMDLEYADVHLNLLDDPNTALIYMQKAYDARPDNIDVNKEMARIYEVLKKPIHLDFHRKRANRTRSLS